MADGKGTAVGGAAGASFLMLPPKPREKSGAEKQADVLEFLKDRAERKPATVEEIFEATNVNLNGEDAEVKKMLQKNPKVEETKDGLFVYQSKYLAENRAALLNLIGRCTSGVSKAELLDTYDGAVLDMEEMIRGGEVIAIKHKEHSTVLLYPRGPTFLTRLSGTVEIYSGQKVAKTTAPLGQELKRGEAVRIGDCWARVSCEVSTSTIDKQPARAAVPETVATDKDLSNRNVYSQPFGPDDLILPLQAPYISRKESKMYVGPVVRHGCSQRIRGLWHETLQQIPKDDEHALHQMLFQTGLVTSASTGQRRPKRFVQLTPEQRESQRSKKKRRQAVVRNARITNDHLEGTTIGLLLEEARMNPEKFGL